MPNEAPSSSEFRLHHYLNVDACLKIPEIKSNAADENVPDNWLDLLTAWCLEKLELNTPDKSAAKDAFLEHWGKHTGADSTYIMKHLLLESLRRVYILIHQYEDRSFQLLVVMKLQEELRACTPGFHSRVNEIISHIGMDSIDGLLANLRRSLVTRASVGMTDEVHARNRFFTVANTMGLGVLPINQDDVYGGAIPDRTIQAALTKTFDAYYQPLSILEKCIEMMHGELRDIGYKGEQNEGYDFAIEYKIFAYLEKIVRDHDAVVADWVNDRMKFRIQAAATADADDDAIGDLIDVNWPKITVKLMQIMCKKGYFRFSEEVERALEFLLVQYPITGSKGHLELSRDKALIQDKYRASYKVLLDNQLILNPTCLFDLLKMLGDVDASFKCSLVKDYVSSLPAKKHKDIWLKILEKESYDSELFKHTTVIDALTKDYLDELKGEYSLFSDSLVAGAAQYHKTKLFIYLKLFDQLTSARKISLLQYTDFSGNTPLMLAARYQPSAVEPLIEVIQKLPEINQKSILKQCSNGYNVLMQAARYQPNAVKPLLKVILNLNILDMLFTEDKDFYTSFLLAICYQPTAVKSLLEVIQTRTPSEQLRIFSKRVARGYNSVLLAIQHQPSVLEDILNVIRQLPVRYQNDILGSSYNCFGQNAVMLAVIHQPRVMPLLLNAMNHCFNDQLKKQLLLEVDQSQRTVFEWAVYSRDAETIMALVRFIAKISVQNRGDVLPPYENLRSIVKNSAQSQEVLKSEAFLMTEMLFQLMRLQAKVEYFAARQKKSAQYKVDYEKAVALFRKLNESYTAYYNAPREDVSAKAACYQVWRTEIDTYRQYVSQNYNIKNILANLSFCATAIGLLILSVSYVYNHYYRRDPKYSFFRPWIKTDIENALDVVAPIVQSHSVLAQPTEPAEPTEVAPPTELTV